MGKPLEISDGTRFGRLTVIEKSIERYKSGSVMWTCRCECGAITTVVGSLLLRGTTRSCGCLRSEIQIKKRTTHGQSRTSLYHLWALMRGRCENPDDVSYANYGGRGIAVCERWKTFENFASDMAVRPEGMTLDRIDNDGNYEPGNCRWATRSEQGRNTRRSLMLELRGEKKNVWDWAEMFGISGGAISKAIGRGHSFESWMQRKGYI